MSEERDGGRTDIYAPDSDWDSDLGTAKAYMVMSGESIEICVNDWIDVQEGILEEDPLWGYAYQVYSTDSDSHVEIRYYNKITDLYELVNVDPIYIYNAFRRVQAVAE